ncbi:MAG: Uncharacterized protein G01um10145_683 [Microgenomates group bacterium Gr01-1014_5]|nr:MAG: Uncharacterized protein G01um10145_683 [Microgenomates group bacterium Gr01-1014_5]
MWKTLKKEIGTYPKTYLFLTILLITGAFIRVYRTNILLGFYYDQGRDAKIIWDFLHNGRVFLIGPTTGIEGIFRGPWYYWLISPFYFLGQGNPVWPAVFLALTTVMAALLAYVAGLKIHSRTAGVVAVMLCLFSFHFMLSARWLSNPTPMYLISMLLVLSLIWIQEGKKWAWILTGSMLGMAMQFGSAAEVFYFPSVALFAFLNKDHLPNIKIWFWSLAVILVSFLPQIIFDLRHEGILRGEIYKFLTKEGSFTASFGEIIKTRISFYEGVFFSKLFVISKNLRTLATVSLIGLFVLFARRFITNKKLQPIIILLFAPMIGMFFFQGNNGNVYDYYFTGYYFVFVLLVAVVLAEFAKKRLGKAFLLIFLSAFIVDNFYITKSYITSGADGPNTIMFRNQLQAVDWVYRMSSGREFNVDVYVPPVIPHAYDYLFLWQGDMRCGQSLCNQKLDSQVPLLYTLYEVDPPHPERLEAWLARQKGIGIVEKTAQFSGITAEERVRIK